MREKKSNEFFFKDIYCLQLGVRKFVLVVMSVWVYKREVLNGYITIRTVILYRILLSNSFCSLMYLCTCIHVYILYGQFKFFFLRLAKIDYIRENSKKRKVVTVKECLKKYKIELKWLLEN